MTLSILKKLGIRATRPTTITHQLVDQGIYYPQEKIEYVFVRVNKFVFLTDYTIIDFSVDEKTCIILGIPFLEIGMILIDVEKVELIIRVNE